MKLLSIFFQYCSIKVFEPLNVYEKCKVFMCSMRCSDNRGELICMIKCLNEILLNKETKKEMRVILLKEHLSYLLKLTSSTTNPTSLLQSSQAGVSNLNANLNCNSSFLSLIDDDGLDLIKSLLDLLESMVTLVGGEEKKDDEQDSKEQDTLTIFVHILGMYLTDLSSTASINTSNANVEFLKRSKELNDFVISKIISLGVGYKLELKAVLEKWPSLKAKIGNALKSSATAASVVNASSNAAAKLAATSAAASNKTPKIQLSFNFSKK